MTAAERPSEVFCAALPPAKRARWAELDGLDFAVVAAHALAVLPEPCSPPSLGRHGASLAQRLGDVEPDCQALARLDHAGIAFADACADGDTRAVAAFHRVHRSDIEKAIRRARVPEHLVDDIRQIVLAKLLPPGRKLARYAGRGALLNWIRAVSVREAISVLRSVHEPVDDVDAVADVAAQSNLELSFLKASYREQFRGALRASFAELDPEDRAVLRYRFLDGLTLEQLATVLGVHRATGARWLARLREDLFRGIRARLCDELGVAREEFDAMVALVRSNLEITMGGLLRE